MFSERLDKLIQSSLQDGVLTDQEKAVILKRAKAEGEDIDEVEIYIDSLLQKRQKELNSSTVKKQANSSSMNELKKLIDAAMTDGVITHNERTVILNKAVALGIDFAEAEVYLDAEIQKVEQKADVEKREKIGPICPKCGKQVPPLTLVCECGYEFTKKKDVSSVQLLFEKINDIQLTKDEIDSCSYTVKEIVGKDYRTVYDADGNVAKEVNQKDLEKLKLKKKLEIIKTFPVPNTKEDIIEFLALSLPNAQTKGGLLGTRKGRILIVLAVIIIVACILGILGLVGIMSEEYVGLLIGFEVIFGILLGSAFVASFDEETLHHNDAAVVWKAKFDQVLLKGRSLRGDPEFTQQLDYYENLLNKK